MFSDRFLVGKFPQFSSSFSTSAVRSKFSQNEIFQKILFVKAVDKRHFLIIVTITWVDFAFSYFPYKSRIVEELEKELSSDIYGIDPMGIECGQYLREKQQAISLTEAFISRFFICFAVLQRR